MRIRRGQPGARPGNFWVGCLVVLVLLLIAAGIGTWFVATSWRGWASDLARQGFDAAIAEVDMPEDQRLALDAEVNGLIDSFEAGDLSLEDLGRIAEGFAESPLLPAVIVMGFDESYYHNNEALTDEQKAEATKQISRFINGVTSEQIAMTKVDDAFDPISDPNGEVQINMGQGNPNLSLKGPDRTTVDELMQVVANMKAEADAAGVEDKRFEVNIADEFTKIVDEALGRTPAVTATEEAPALPEGDSPGGE